MTALLEAHHLYKTFQTPKPFHVLRDISLQLFPGESIAIVGASGEGKSTLLHLLAGLDAPTKGDISFNGQPFRNFSLAELRNKHFGFIFQSFYLLDEDSSLQNVLLPAQIGRQPTGKHSKVYARATDLLKEVGLQDHLDTPVKLLSGGERQRVALARALCNNPEVLFADEPTGNLDHRTSKEIHQLLIAHTQEANKGLLVVTHDLDLASLCDSTYCLESGLLTKQS